MIDTIFNLAQFEDIGNRTEGFIYQKFFTEEQIGLVHKEAEKILTGQKDKMRVDGMVGVAYERYVKLYLCPNQKELAPKMYDFIEEKIFSLRKFSEYSCKWCAALVRFNAIDGMTSHKDYSYNLLMLGTLILDGKILFGSSLSEREEAYDPSNTVLANKGDFIGLKAPNKYNKQRPFFSVLSPIPSLIIRLWMRDQYQCSACSGGYHG